MTKSAQRPSRPRRQQNENGGGVVSWRKQVAHDDAAGRRVDYFMERVKGRPRITALKAAEKLRERNATRTAPQFGFSKPTDYLSAVWFLDFPS
jgi:hypothetical protein